MNLEEYERSVLRITDLYEHWISSPRAAQACLDQVSDIAGSATNLRFAIALILPQVFRISISLVPVCLQHTKDADITAYYV